ncbi:hypothetical protein D918_00624 [Trichuris suis]|nr:hypothetical protein D918_00624 [Trichuris suis]
MEMIVSDLLLPMIENIMHAGLRPLKLRKETAIHVSLLSSTAQSFAPGNYNLTFTDDGFCLSAEMATLRMEVFHFDRIAWLGRGVGCLAFQLRNGHLFELTSERAEAIARYIQHRASLNPTTRKPNNLRLQYESSLDAFQAEEYSGILPEEVDDSSGSVLNSWRKLKATLRNRFKSHKTEDQSSGDSSEIEQADLDWMPRRGRRQITRSYSERSTPPAGHFRPNPLYLESIRSSGFFSAESQTDELPPTVRRQQSPYMVDSYRKVQASRNSVGELPYTDGQSLGSVITDV